MRVNNDAGRIDDLLRAAFALDFRCVFAESFPRRKEIGKPFNGGTRLKITQNYFVADRFVETIHGTGIRTIHASCVPQLLRSLDDSNEQSNYQTAPNLVHRR